MTDLKDNEILVTAYPVRYTTAEYCDDYVTITQNRTRRRVYNGYHFDDDGRRIWVSESCCYFQCGRKPYKYVVNTVTKEWRRYHDVIVERHFAEHHEPIEQNEINDLKK